MRSIFVAQKVVNPPKLRLGKKYVKENEVNIANETLKILRAYMKSGSPEIQNLNLPPSPSCFQNGKNRGGNSIFKANGEDSERRVE